MMKLKSLLAALLVGAFFVGNACAQGVGQLGPGQVWGNSGASQDVASPTNLSPLFDRGFGSSNNNMIARVGGVWGPQPLAGPCNIRPSSETSYAIQSTDDRGCIVVTNPTATETLTLPNAATNYPFAVTVFVRPTTVTAAIPTIMASAGGQISGHVSNNLAPCQSASYWSDGTNWNQSLGITACQPGAGGFVGNASMSYSTATLPVGVTLSGTCTAGDIVGFNYASSLFTTRQYRHTMTTASTCLQDAANDLASQFKSDTTVQNAIGADIVSFANVIQSGSNWSFYFNQSWPFVVNNPPTTTAFTSGGATETVTVGGGGTNLETGGGFYLGHSTLNLGRPPQAGDAISNLYWCADNTTTACNTFAATPFYGQMGASITNPSPSVQTGALAIFFNSISFFNQAAAGVAFGGVGINTGTPQAYLHVNQNAVGNIPASAGTAVLVTGADGSSGNVEVKGTNAPSYLGTSFSGTGASPAAVTASNYLLQMAGQGYDGSAYGVGASIYVRPGGTWTPSDHNAFLSFNTVPSGSTTVTEAGRFSPSGGFSVGATVDPGSGSVRALNSVGAGINGTAGGKFTLSGSTSGFLSQVVQAAAGTPTITWGTGSGTPAVSASNDTNVTLSLNTSTGNLAAGWAGTLAVARGGTGDSGTAWSTYTPTVSCGSGTITTLGTVAGRYKTIGKTVDVIVVVPITTVGTCTGSITASLPVTAANTGLTQSLMGRENGVTGHALVGAITSNTSNVIIANYDNSTPAANSAIVEVEGVYESN